MPYYLLHAGTSLQRMSTDGTITTLPLPSGITISATRAMRTAILNRRLVIVRAPSKNLLFDPATLGLYPLTFTAPTVALTSAAGAVGLPSGTYRYRYTFARKVAGVVVSESGMSPASTPLTVTSKAIDLSVIAASADATCNCRRIYRTLTDGADYYNVADLNDNTTTTLTDTQADYDVQLLPALDIASNPPGADSTDSFRIVTAWRSRIWASPTLYPDRVYFSESDQPCLWGASSFFSIKPEGLDQFGIIGFLDRRDELGIGKRRSLWKIVGDTRASFQPIRIAEGVGVLSAMSIVTIRDRVYFLSDDGVYEWGPEGAISLSSPKVHPWFNTDDYFNRTLFPVSFGVWNQKHDTYELHLAAAGNTVLDRSVSFDLQGRKWLGPHRTSAFSPTCGGLMEDADGRLWPVLGASSGYLYRGNSTSASDDGTPIAFDVLTAAHHNGDPDLTYFWGELSVLAKREESGGTLIVTPTVGELNDPAQAPLLHDLSAERTREAILGVGRLLQLRFENAENNQPLDLYGYKLPVHVVGRR